MLFDLWLKVLNGFVGLLQFNMKLFFLPVEPGNDILKLNDLLTLDELILDDGLLLLDQVFVKPFDLFVLFLFL